MLTLCTIFGSMLTTDKKLNEGMLADFPTALSYLKMGYIIRKTTNDNYYLIMLNKIIFCLNIDPIGDQSKCYVASEFSAEDVSNSKWYVYNSRMLGDRDVRRNRKN